MKCFGFKGSFVMAVALLFLVAAMPTSSGDPPGAGAIAFLDSPGDVGGISSVESHPVGVQVADMKDGIFAGPPLLSAIVLVENGKTLPSHRTGKGIITVAEYSRPPDLNSPARTQGVIKTGHSGTVHIGSGAFIKRIGVRQHI
ncbi:hypothetical protein KAR91_77565 [Candidatus Pacearchaeota archaeon]|nr:hypothetical protein [Candidatus Pacearchaeota archaeon]